MSNLGVIPASFFAIFYEGTKTVDIFINARVEKRIDIVDASTTFKVFNMAHLRNLLGVSSLHWYDVYQSNVILQSNNPSAINDLYGRTGLHFNDTGEIGRAYGENLGIFGGWAYNTEIYLQGNVFTILIHRANYT